MRKIGDLIKQAYKWIATDGMLHILACAVIVLCFQPICGTGISIAIALMFGGLKEYYDIFIQKDNNYPQGFHDLICDVMGIVIAVFVILILW